MSAGAVPLDRLVNLTTIAAILGVGKSTAATWRTRDPEFPKPLATPGVAGVNLWDVQDIIRWRNRHRSAPKKPPTSVDPNYVDKYRRDPK